MTKRIRIVPDNDYQWDRDDDIKIAYLAKSRYCLGTEAVTESRMAEIRDGVHSGDLVGLPVFAYVHSGVALSTTEFSDPWDSGRSGFVYSEDKSVTHDQLRRYLAAFNQCLAGDVWGFIAEEQVEMTGQREDGTLVERGEWVEVDSCWGFLGSDPETNGMKEHVEELLKQGYVWTDEEGNAT